jgi:hypothetical protein
MWAVMSVLFQTSSEVSSFYSFRSAHTELDERVGVAAEWSASEARRHRRRESRADANAPESDAP